VRKKRGALHCRTPSEGGRAEGKERIPLFLKSRGRQTGEKPTKEEGGTTIAKSINKKRAKIDLRLPENMVRPRQEKKTGLGEKP